MERTLWCPGNPEPLPEPVPPRRYRCFMRIVAWFYAGSTILLLLFAVTTAILLNSTRFHNYIIRTAEQLARESLGVRMQLQNYALSLSNLRLDIYGVTVDGASPYSNPPLLQVQHAEASMRIISILQKNWYLDDIRVDQPGIGRPPWTVWERSTGIRRSFWVRPALSMQNEYTGFGSTCWIARLFVPQSGRVTELRSGPAGLPQDIQCSGRICDESLGQTRGWENASRCAGLQRVPTSFSRFVAPSSTIGSKCSSASGYRISDDKLLHHFLIGLGPQL
jgi:hypothetical protein